MKYLVINKKIYIQSALNVDTEEKQDQETSCLKNQDLGSKMYVNKL